MIRAIVIFIVSVIVFSGSLVATLATISQRNLMLRGYADPIVDTPLPFTVPRLGVNAELLQYTPQELDQHLTRMAESQITWVRQFVYWDQVEAQSGNYDWQAWDIVTQAFARQPQLKLVVVLMNTPVWARESTNPSAPPEDTQAFARFAQAFAARYGHIVDYYQIWDEPNLSAAWGQQNPRPVQYVRLLQLISEAIRQADTSAYILLAALAPTVEQGPENISDWRYLEDIYALGAAPYFDIVAGKPYGFTSTPEDRVVHEQVLNFSRIIRLREIMVEAGDAHKPVWASAWGWNSLPQNWQGAPSIWGNASTNEQIAYTLDALERAEREWPWMGGMILQHWQPDAADNDPVWGFSLLPPASLDATPLLKALANRESVSIASNGLYAATNPYATYSGVWTFSDMGADIGWINDSQVQFEFSGTEIALLLRQDDYVAYFYPRVDDVIPQTLPVDAAGNAYIVLTSDTLRPSLDLVPVDRNLSAGQHTLTLVADDLVPDDLPDRWALVGFAVSDGNLAQPYNRQIIVGVFTTLVTLITLIYGVWQLPRSANNVLSHLWEKLGSAGQLLISAITSIALMIGMLLAWGDIIPAVFRREPVHLGVALITAGLAYMQPGLVITLLALGLLFVMIYNRPEIGLALTILWAPFFLFPLALYQFAFPMAEVLILLTAAAWGLRLLASWARDRQSAVSQFPSQFPALTQMDIAVSGLILLGLLSITWAKFPALATTEWRMLLLEPFLFYIILRTYNRNHRTATLLIDALLIAGVLVAVIGLWQHFMADTAITAEGGARRLVSVYGSPNNVALFLGRCIPFLLAYVLIAQHKLRRWLSLMALLPIGAALIFTQSAGALFLGVPLSVLTVLLLVWRRRAVWPLAGLGVVFIAAFTVATTQSARFARLLDMTSGTNFIRLRVWQSALNIIRDYPFAGIGLDQFLYFFQGQYIQPDAWQEPQLSHPHNFLLDFWVRLGIVGVALLIWIQSAFWLRLRQCYRIYQQQNSAWLVIIVGLIGSMVNVLAHGLVDNSVFVHDLAYVFMLILGLSQNIPLPQSDTLIQQQTTGNPVEM